MACHSISQRDCCPGGQGSDRAWRSPSPSFHPATSTAGHCRPFEPQSDRPPFAARSGDSLEATVRGLRYRPRKRLGIVLRRQVLYAGRIPVQGSPGRRVLQANRNSTVWDLGANTGYFSRLACELGISTIAFDFDPACVEWIYLEARARNETRLLPLMSTCSTPAPHGLAQSRTPLDFRPR